MWLPSRRDALPYHNGISYDATRNPGRGGRVVIKVPGAGPKIGGLTDFFTFTGDNLSMFRGANGLLVSSQTNTPRIEYDAVGSVRGLLIEGARTNSQIRSHGSTTSWAATGLINFDVDEAGAPDGTATFMRLRPSTANTQHYVETTGFLTTAAAWTFSCFFKANGYRWVRFARDTAVLSVDTLTGTISQSSGVTASGVVDYGNGIYRVWFTYTAAATSPQFFVAVNNADSLSTLSFAGDGTSAVLIWGMQGEIGSFPSSYIPTTTGSVTRAADVVSRTYGAEYNTSLGTAFAEFRNDNYANLGTAGIFARDANSRHLFTNSNPQVRCFDGTNAITGGTVTASQIMRSASSFDSNGQSITLGGAAVTIGSYDGSWGAGTDVYLGAIDSGGASPFFGHIRRLDYWPERKSDAFLRRITSVAGVAA